MKIVSVNIGSAQTVDIRGRPTETGLFKKPVDHPVFVCRDGLKNDSVIAATGNDKREQAVSAYPLEHYRAWSTELQRTDIGPGHFGENLTVEGALENRIRIGDIFNLGTCVLQVSHPRTPCKKLNWRMGGRFLKRFLRSGRVGFYFRVLKPGHFRVGDSATLLERDANSPTVAEFHRLAYIDYWDAVGLEDLLRAKALSGRWVEELKERATRARNAKSWLGSRPLQVVDETMEAVQVVSLRLRCLYGRVLPPYQGGQLLPFLVPSETGSGDYASRAFALTGDPRATHTYQVTVRADSTPKIWTGGAVSSFRDAGLEVGSVLRATAPTGSFTYPAHAKHVVLVTEGLGVASAIGVLWDAARTHPAPRLTLIHCDANGATHALREEMTRLCHLVDSDLRVYYRHPRADDCYGTDYQSRGWIALNDIDDYSQWRHDSAFLLAGSQVFVDSLRSELQNDDVPTQRITTQSFGTGMSD